VGHLAGGGQAVEHGLQARFGPRRSERRLKQPDGHQRVASEVGEETPRPGQELAARGKEGEAAQRRGELLVALSHLGACAQALEVPERCRPEELLELKPGERRIARRRLHGELQRTRAS